MNCQDLFPLKNDEKKIECSLLQILLGTLRVKTDLDSNKRLQEVKNKFELLV